MIEAGMLIKHDRMLDTSFEVLYVTHDFDWLKVTGYWMNNGFKKSWIIDVCLHTIDIEKSDLKYWYVSTGNNINPECHRLDSWSCLGGVL